MQRRAEAFGHRLTSDGGGHLPGEHSAAPEAGPGTAAAAGRSVIQPMFKNLSRVFSSVAPKVPKFDPSTYNPKLHFPLGNELFRADNHPFTNIQPGYGTKKSGIDEEGTLKPVDESGTTSPALHVHGKPEDKAKSSYTSFSSNLAKTVLYGKNLIQIDPQELRDQVVDQPSIQKDISESQDPRLKEVARNVTQPGAPLWKPDPEQELEAKELGIDPSKPEFTYQDRAALNSQRDEENLLQGPTSEFQYWHHIDASTFGSKYANIDWEKVGKEQGRDPRNVSPTGYRIPLTPHGILYLAHKQALMQQQKEIESERQETRRNSAGSRRGGEDDDLRRDGRDPRRRSRDLGRAWFTAGDAMRERARGLKAYRTLRKTHLAAETRAGAEP